MKNLCVMVVAVLAVGASSWAQTNAFPVKMRGIITGPASPTTVAKFGVTEQGLLSAPTDHIVLVIDQTDHEIRLWEVDANTNGVAELMNSRRLALLPDRSFSAGMRFDFVLPPQSGGNEVNGELQVTSKISAPHGVPQKLTAAVIGVFNDSVSGATNNADITLKGKLTPDGKAFDGGPFGL